MPLAVMPQPWDHPDWFWEIKYDGFRSLAYVEKAACRLVSRKHAPYRNFEMLEATNPQGCGGQKCQTPGSTKHSHHAGTILGYKHADEPLHALFVCSL
jgi:hypothetical protein